MALTGELSQGRSTGEQRRGSQGNWRGPAAPLKRVINRMEAYTADMKRTLSALALLALTFAGAQTAPAPTLAPNPANKALNISGRSLQTPDSIRWVTVDEIRASLPDRPINVSFDIDDTVLSTSGCFWWGQQTFSPGSNDYLKKQLFWDAVNGCDRFSIPKGSARALIKMHQDRNDQIFFITGRTAPRQMELLTPLLVKTFGSKNMHFVNFSGGIPHDTQYDKTPFLKALNIDLHYGDSDNDITAAMEAGPNVRAIRVIRAANSTNLPMPAVGSFNEEVLRDSAW